MLQEGSARTMSDVGRLLESFEAGLLVRPSPDVPNSVDLSQAIATLAGVGDLELTKGAERIVSQVGQSDHYVLALVDGLGAELVEQLAKDSFLRSHMCMTLQAVFPSTTVAALTSLATGLWPSVHGVPTWWSYLVDYDVSATVLPFIERFSKRPLGKWGIKSSDVFTVPTLPPRFRCERHSFVPKAITSSVYTSYTSGGAEVTGYTTLSEAVDVILTRIGAARAPTYSYLYYPLVDALAHERGPEDDAVHAEVVNVDRELSRLADGIKGRARLMTTADHGLVAVRERDRHVVRADDDIADLLIAPPSGEPRVPLFHVKEGKAQEFERRFRDRFGEWFVLLTASEAERLELFGPGPFADVTRQRVGDYLALPLGEDVLAYEPPEDWMVGFHAGLTPAEMLVPLILA